MKSGYFAIMWNGRYCGASEMNHHQHTKGHSSSKEGDVAYIMGFEGHSLLTAPSGKPNDYKFQQVLLPIRPSESNT